MKKISIIVFLILRSVIAMNPAFPEEMNFFSPDRKVTLTISKDKRALIKIKKNTLLSNEIEWKDKIDYPAEVLIVNESKRIYLMGGDGDAGIDLGKILIYDFEGNIIKNVNVKDAIPDLEALARENGLKGNFPWIKSFNYSESQKYVTINVCDKKIINIDENGKILKVDILDRIEETSYGKIVLLKSNQSLKFPDFSLRLIEEIDPEEGSEVKSTANVRIRKFAIVENGNEKTFQISHGQLPPGPYPLELKTGKYIIYTYLSPEGERLFPDKIYIKKD